MLQLNYRDNRPLYEQIRDGFRRLIATGVIGEGEKLPSVRSLALELTINPNTIQRAYSELEAEGYLHSIAGKGSFACLPSEVVQKHQLLAQATTLCQQLKTYGCSLEEWLALYEKEETR